MNFTRQQTNAGLLYVGTETDGVNFEIAKTKTGQYELTAGGEIAGTFKLLKDAKAEATRIEREILDAAVARRKARIEASGIVPGALVEVKGRKPSLGPVRVKHVTASAFVELERPDGGTFRREAEDLTLVEPSSDPAERHAAEVAADAERAEITAEALATLDADIDAHNAAVEARKTVRRSGELSIHRGDVVRLGHREGEWTVRKLRAHGRAEVERASDGEVAEVPGHNIVEILETAHPQPEAPVEISKAGSIVAGEERIQTAGGVSIGDRAEISGDDSVWTVNQIIEVDGGYLYRLRDESRPAGFRSTWRLGEEITLVSDDEVVDAEIAEFSEEEILSERHDSAVRFKPEQWPTTPAPAEPEGLVVHHYGPTVVVPNEEESRTFNRTETALAAARVEAEALALGDRVAYSGSRGLEAWTVVGRRNQGGFVSIHLRELSGTTSWMTTAELASAVVDGRALLIKVAGEPVRELPLDEAGILAHVGGVLDTWATDYEETIETSTEIRHGQPVLSIEYAGGSYELYATRVG
ncbi:hypothetical protein SEA_KLEVEY_52 [Arthrobacter phage Klevey]|uniref:Uncharacterized protein n=1 Tax=Arthrobacter phage Klevey TaxID=2867481 RepID=A0AAE8XLG0_9CAUD|nr:hypothetical protein SEA_KLEVEY_52 [Arthrobacter phage Klevey]